MVRLHATAIALLLLTALSVGSSAGFGRGDIGGGIGGGLWSVWAVLLLALAKAAALLLNFLELRLAPGAWRAGLIAFLIAVVAAAGAVLSLSAMA